MTDRRPLLDRQRDWLQTELDLWRTSGLVTSEQQAGILDLYESTQEVSRRNQSWVVFVLQSLAMSLVALAILLLVGFNWQYLPGGLRIGLVLTSMLAAHATGFWLQGTRQKPMAAQIAFFLGCCLYGTAIWQIGQVYHVNSENADALWLWALGILPFALLLESSLLHCLLVAVLATWVGFEMLGIGSNRWWGWGRIPYGCYSLPLLAVPGILWSYHASAKRTLALYIPLVSLWLIVLPITWNPGNTNPVYFIGIVAALFLAVAEAHRVGDPMSIPFRFYGVIITAGLLLLLSVVGFQKELLRQTEGGHIFERFLFPVIGLGVVVGLNHWGSSHANDSTQFFKRLFQRYWFPLGIIVFYGGISLWGLMWGSLGYRVRLYRETWSFQALVPCLISNIATVAMALWLMKIGLREDRGRLFSSGVILVLLWAVSRYVDLFGGAGGMLGAALIFFLCGAGLFGLARFWSLRKEAV
jgi:uncharacterized membrane protein